MSHVNNPATAEARRILAILPTDRAPTLAELAAALVPPPPAPRPGPAEVWVFGAFPVGHHLYTMARRRPLDTLAVPLSVEQATDDIGNTPREAQVEGAIVHRPRPFPAGWSFVSWWDRQGDARHSSHTGILARGEWAEAELIAAGRRLAPWAFRVEVRL